MVPAVTAPAPPFALSLAELRAVAGYAVACAARALALYEGACPGDDRPRAAIAAAHAFTRGAPRSKAMRDAAWAAHRAAQETRDAGRGAASDAARAAGHAVGAAFLHPLPQPTQVRHILGAAVHAARAFELAGGGEAVIGAAHLARAGRLASPTVVDVLRRYPRAPAGGGRVGALLQALDAVLRAPWSAGAAPGGGDTAGAP